LQQFARPSQVYPLHTNTIRYQSLSGNANQLRGPKEGSRDVPCGQLPTWILTWTHGGWSSPLQLWPKIAALGMKENGSLVERIRGTSKHVWRFGQVAHWNTNTGPSSALCGGFLCLSLQFTFNLQLSGRTESKPERERVQFVEPCLKSVFCSLLCRPKIL